jgi:hypothetical protein
MTTPTTNYDLLADIDTWLTADQDAGDTQPETVENLQLMLLNALGEINAIMRQRAAALTSPLTGDAQERYNALIAASAEQYNAWAEIGATIDMLNHYRALWRADGERMNDLIKNYAAVFGFDLPDELRPDEPPSDQNPFSDNLIPF